MPELPEVETVRRGLERRLLGQMISTVVLARPQVIRGDTMRFCGEIEGRRVARLCRKGKTLAIELHSKDGGPPHHLIIRLGMTGQLVIAETGAPLLPHTHVRMILEGGVEELRFRDPRRFGMLRCCTTAEARGVFNSLGPDALEISEGEFDDAIRGRNGAVKAWLLNQQMLAGLGNIYADEALFEARIHPQTPAGRIRKLQRHLLYRAIHKVLRRAVNLQGTSFRDYIDVEGNAGRFEPLLRAYRRTGLPCRRCGARIQRVTISGRSSHFCPDCQPRPRKQRSR
ncbi:MAG: bifunctional DNA-formamidopyrimidine glycosylase/DNA-(apurinic or apyrimidinic site) lyase [Terriglobia bacterium]